MAYCLPATTLGREGREKSIDVYAAGLVKATVVDARGEPTIGMPLASTGAIATVTWSVVPRTGSTTSVSAPLTPAVNVCAA